MKDLLQFLIDHSGIALIMLLIIIGIIISVIILIHKHWSTFSTLVTFSQNIDTILNNQKEMKLKHVEISDQVSKIAAETIPNGSNKIRIVYDKIDVIANNVNTILLSQEYQSLEFEGRLEVDKIPIFKCNADGICTFANSSLCHLFGTTQEHMTGLGWGSFIIAREQDRVFKNWKRFIDSNGTEIEDSYPIQTHSGLKNITYKAIAKFDKDGKRLFIIGTAWDNNKRTKEDLECLFEMASKIEKTSIWKNIKSEIATNKTQ